ncbi:hypothetical protein LN042_11570 [Kitasatospora sp. RB6PN24]|uniref:hypothetical protein n=1 Tax=Kitasatospora humi TaxID=2893891 RepID=UPI001E4D6DDA|nr:hypothetical protein [Kitasatospora humi]MCC9307728.1 hypothetical protein [Kitasatospora humi]
MTAQPLTGEQLAAIRQRVNYATDGPWWNDEHEIYAGTIDSYDQWVGETCDPGAGGSGSNNAEFIAHARQDVPALLAEVEQLRAEHARYRAAWHSARHRAIDLAAELGDRDKAARERWIQQQEQQLGIHYADFRAGRWEMDLAMAREMAAAYVAMAKTLLGDAPNYSETRLEFDVKIAEQPETYTLVVQRHASDALTPHEARQRAEAERDQALEQVAAARAVHDQWAEHCLGPQARAMLADLQVALGGPE